MVRGQREGADGRYRRASEAIQAAVGSDRSDDGEGLSRTVSTDAGVSAIPRAPAPPGADGELGRRVFPELPAILQSVSRVSRRTSPVESAGTLPSGREAGESVGEEDKAGGLGPQLQSLSQREEINRLRTAATIRIIHQQEYLTEPNQAGPGSTFPHVVQSLCILVASLCPVYGFWKSRPGGRCPDDWPRQAGWRKVRASQGRAVPNGDRERSQGKCHRKHTARLRPGGLRRVSPLSPRRRWVRVKR